MNTPIKEVLGDRISNVFFTSPDSTVSEAVQEMNKHQVGALLVMSNNELVGIFTERDVLTRVIAANRDPRLTPVNRVMTSNPTTISLDDTIADVLQMHSKKHFRHLPVMNVNHIVGMISIRDVLRRIADNNGHKVEQLADFIESGHVAD